MSADNRTAQLPIHELAEDIRSRLGSSNRLVIEAPTGSGKSTQVPQILLDSGLCGQGVILVLQPRRLPTRMLAARVAAERGTALGDEVGYQIRMDKVGGDSVRIRYITEGVLLRRLAGDPHLKGVAAVVLDEFHERHIESDLSLACLLLLQNRRPDLKLIVMSATLDAGKLAARLQPCSLLASQGRTYPVSIEHVKTAASTAPWDAAADAFYTHCKNNADTGDVLVFMPGSYEIHKTIQALRELSCAADDHILPLYGELTPEEQDRAVAPAKERKIIVSTNVAETSLTIDGVRLVIDCGLARKAAHDAHRGINTLTVEKISRASADQRAGRAGRTAPGHCIRLWSEEDHRGRPGAETPEILRLDLAEALLAVGCIHGNLNTFPWFEQPSKAAFDRAFELLCDLGALHEDGSLTDIGIDMSSYPLHPRFGRMLVEAQRRGCVEAACWVAALSQSRDILLRQVDARVRNNRDDLLPTCEDSDFLRALYAFQFARNRSFRVPDCKSLGIHAGAAREVGLLAERLLKLVPRTAGKSDSGVAAGDANIKKCVLSGFPDRVAMRLDGGTLRCQMVHQRRGSIGKSSCVRDGRLLVASAVTEISRGGGELEVVLDQVTAIDVDWLEEVFPGTVQTCLQTRWEPTQRRVIAGEVRTYHDLVLEERLNAVPDADEAAAILADKVLSGECPLKHWDDQVRTWEARVNLAAGHGDFPTIDNESRRLLLVQLCAGHTSYKQIKDLPVLPVFKTWLQAWQQKELDRLLPERWQASGGRPLKIRYAEGKEPVLSARIQDLYDLKAVPCLFDGKITMVVEILAPNFRPVQITTDLQGFWNETYPSLKGQLQRRYPKHEWR